MITVYNVKPQSDEKRPSYVEWMMPIILLKVLAKIELERVKKKEGS